MTKVQEPDCTARDLLTSSMAKLLLAVVPSELRDAFEGDLHERLQHDVLREHGIDDARRWLRAELARSLPRLLEQRAVGGSHPKRRSVFAILLLALAAWEAGARAERFAPLSLFASALPAVVCSIAIVLRARRALEWIWIGNLLITMVVAVFEHGAVALPLSYFAVIQTSLLRSWRFPEKWWTWRFLTTWDGGRSHERRSSHRVG